MIVFCILTVIAQSINLWLINLRHVVVYPLVIGVYLGYSAVEVWLATEVSPVLFLFVALNLVGIVTAIIGWKRHTWCAGSEGIYVGNWEQLARETLGSLEDLRYSDEVEDKMRDLAARYELDL